MNEIRARMQAIGRAIEAQLPGWRCPECGHQMTERESQLYTGCPSGMHFVQHEPLRYGFVVMCFPFDAPPDTRGEYCSNAKRADVVRMLQEFINRNPMSEPELN